MPATEKHCDLCGTSQFETIGKLDRHNQPLETVVCTTCGLVVHEHVPSEEELAAFYAKDYRKAYHGELTPSNRRVMRAWRNGLWIRSRLAPWLKKQSRVFEVGAGIGCTVKAFERGGYSASGIEPNEGFQTYSRERLRAEIANDFLFNLPPQPKHDLVLLVHVIEHFQSPRRALEHLHSIVRPDGLLYVECPNIGAPFATRKRLFHYAHIHNFTPATFTMMAQAAGFEVVKWFTPSDDPNLEVLLKRVERQPLTIDPKSYARTLAALERFNWATYHARGCYWYRRIRQVSSYLSEFAVADRYVAQLLREIEQEAEPAWLGQVNVGRAM